jgi:hypothetical protein
MSFIINISSRDIAAGGLTDRPSHSRNVTEPLTKRGHRESRCQSRIGGAMAACDGMNMNGPDQNYLERNFAVLHIYISEKLLNSSRTQESVKPRKHSMLPFATVITVFIVMLLCKYTIYSWNL